MERKLQQLSKKKYETFYVDMISQLIMDAGDLPFHMSKDTPTLTKQVLVELGYKIGCKFKENGEVECLVVIKK